MKEPFTITEVHRANTLMFEFMSFREVAERLKEALFKGIIKRNKRYIIEIKEVHNAR